MLLCMTSSPINQTASFTSLEDKPVFNVAIAYEDFATGQRAHRLIASLARQIGAECEVFHNTWKFDVLRMPRLRQVAADDAAMADMVILALHEDYGVPQQIRAWIEEWLPQKNGKTTALVVLLDTVDELSDSIASTRTYFRDVARRGKMDLFLHTDANEDNVLGQRPLAPAIFCDDRAPDAHWGIND
jgi:hypothetical protein